MDIGFLCESTFDFSCPNRKEGRIVESFDGYNCYLIVVNKHSSMMQTFLFASKDPPITDITVFLSVDGLALDNIIRWDQGGKLARSHNFPAILQRDHSYKVKPTGVAGSSQEGVAENHNNILVITTRNILYGASLHAKFWSVALSQAV